MSRRELPALPATCRAWVALVVLLVALLTLVGCGGGSAGAGKTNTISGKVTCNGQPVAGEVTFIGAGNKEVRSPIGTDGNYTIIDAAKGENTILVKGFPGAASVPRNAPAMPGMPSSTGVPPPAKYAQPNNGLKVSVTGGKQTHDLPLSP